MPSLSSGRGLALAWLVAILLAGGGIAAALALRHHHHRLRPAPAGTGTVYVESDVAAPDQNSVLALHYHDGLLRPLAITEYPTGGAGAADLLDRGVLDADQQIVTNPSGTLLFAINQGSDTIAAFHVAPDGALTAVAGSPFPSQGIAPASIGVDGDLLVVADKALDGVRSLRSVAPDYATLRILPGGALRSTGQRFTLPLRSAPTQVLIAPGGHLVFATEESGLLRVLQISRSGRLTQAPGSPYGVPPSIVPVTAPRVWPAGLSARDGVLYSGIPNHNSIVTYDYTASGRLTLQGQWLEGQFLPCWSVISPNGREVYFANAGSDSVTAWDLSGNPRRPTVLQTLSLPGGGNSWNLRIDPTGRFLFIITPRQVAKLVPAGQGQLLHSLRISPSGTLSEMPGSPIPLPVSLGTNPFGLVLLGARAG